MGCKSDFCKKNLAEISFRKLLEKNSGCRTIVISYNSDAIVSFSKIIALLRKGRNVDVYRISYREFISHKEQEKSRIYEYLFVGVLDDDPSSVSFYEL
jgi:adenine-specific DNA methylase